MTDLEIEEEVGTLEAARGDAGLVAAIPPVVAAGFGVIPIRREADGGLLVAASGAGAPGRFETLERIVSCPVRHRPFHELVLRTFLPRIYLEGKNINFPTFRTADFLEDPACARILAAEKKDDPEVSGTLLPAGQIAIVEASIRSDLEDLDSTPISRAVPHGFESYAPALAFRVRGHVVTCYREHPLDPEVSMLLQEDVRYGGLDHEHGVRSAEVKTFPHLVHPTEIQIAALGDDGSLGVYCYDRVAWVKPESAPETFSITYYFLSFGRRLKRRLTYRIQSILILPRGRLVEEPPSADRWTPQDLARWLAFDPIE